MLNAIFIEVGEPCPPRGRLLIDLQPAIGFRKQIRTSMGHLTVQGLSDALRGEVQQHP
jgi:hypothetical protein